MEWPREELTSAKRAVLLHLKRKPGASLKEIAANFGVSRSAAFKHLTKLEDDRLVERFYRSGSMGRPRVCFRLAPAAQRVFPAAYAQAAICAMGFIERREGRPAVVEMLRERATELQMRHAPRIAGKGLTDRVRELGHIRDEEGYMAETRRLRGKSLELLEHNCPILEIAERYGEACEVERRLFSNLLDADVAVRHRVVAGDPVCRFLVQPKVSR